MVQVVALALGKVGSVRDRPPANGVRGGVPVRQSQLPDPDLPPTVKPGNSAGVGGSTIQAQIIDDCGNAVTSGSAQVTFSNGDPGINLNSIGAGIWEATWVPQNAATSATSPDFASIGMDSPAIPH